MLSASEPVIPYISAFTDRSSSPLNSSKDLLHHSDLECEWCKSLLDSQDLQGVKEFLLDMFGRCRGERQCFALLTRGLERVRRVKGPEAWQAFFEKQEETKQPIGYMCLAHEVWSTYKTAEEAYEFAACAFDTFLVIALQAEPKKVKPIPWRRNSSSQVSFPRLVCSGSMSPSHFQHNLARFKYAGQLKKSSFSPYMPYSSVLSERVPKFTGDRTNFCGLIGSARLFLKNAGAVLHSMVVHVLEDCNGDHYLVNITNVVWEEKGRLTLMPIAGEEPRIPTLTLPAKLKTEAKKSPVDLFTRSITRAPYIDSTEIRQKNIDLYQRSLPNQLGCSSPSVPFLPLVTHSLTEIADKLDEQRRKLELSKQAQLIYATLNRPEFRESVQLAWRELTKNDLLRRYFQGVPEERVMLVADQFYLTLIQPRTSSIGKNIDRRAHV